MQTSVSPKPTQDTELYQSARKLFIGAGAIA